MIRSFDRSAATLLTLGLLVFGGCDQDFEEPAELLAEGDHDVDGAAIDAAGSTDLTNATGGVAQTPGFDLAIAKQGADITLTWADQGGADYEVWVSSDPYFAPGDEGSSALALGVEGLTFTHSGGNDLQERYYRVIATQVTDGVSTTVGKLTYDLEVGYTKMGMCLISEVDTSAELFEDMESDALSAHMFDGENQVWDSAWDGPWGTISFNVGEVVSVEHSHVSPKTYNMVGHVPVAEDIDVTLHPGDNLVATLPLRFGDMMASDLHALVPDASRIGMWDAVNQVTVWFPQDGDFALPTCSPVHVEVTSESSWPPPMPESVESSCPCDLSVAGLAELGMNETNTCDDTIYEQYGYDLLWLEDTYGSYAYSNPEYQICARYSSQTGFYEYHGNLTAEVLADCSADIDGLIETFDADLCTY